MKWNFIQWRKQQTQPSNYISFLNNKKDKSFILFRQSMKFAELIDGIKIYYNSTV